MSALLMISGDRSLSVGKRGAFWYTLEELHRHWDRIDVICPRAQGSAPSPFPNVFLHPSPHGLLRQSAWITKRGGELIAEHHHDVMTVQEYPPFYNGRGARMLSSTYRIPTVLEVHHIVGAPCAASVFEWVGRMLSRFILPREARWATALRVVNGEVRGALIGWGIDPARVHVVPSVYADLPLIQTLPPASPTFDLVFCARLVANKGLLPVLDAVAKCPGVRVLVLGDGPLRGTAESRVKKLNIADRVEFRGWVPDRKDLYAAIRSAKYFVMNSLSEGGPRVAAEALACGVPLITTRVGLMPGLVREGMNGVFTDGTLTDLASIFTRLLPDTTKRTQMSAAAALTPVEDRQTCIRRYSAFLHSFAR